MTIPLALARTGRLIALASAVIGTGSCRTAPSVSVVEYMAVSAGNRHTCALSRAGTAYCWGGNAKGQLGNGTTDGSLKPVRVSGAMTFTRITAGFDHTCGISQGGVFCWGSNVNGQIGNGTVTPQPVLLPTAASTPPGVAFNDISAGYNATCALATTGRVFCWGETVAGKLGPGAGAVVSAPGNPSDPAQAVTTPTEIASGGFYRAIATRGDTTCALATNNYVYCWGANDYSELGPVTAETCPFPSSGGYACSRSPVRIGTGSGDGIAVGWDLVCYTNAYDLYCLGSNAGQTIQLTGSGLGPCPNTLPECSPAPVKRPRPGPGVGYVLIAAGRSFVCGSLYPVGQSVVCWGRNGSGQLGDGTTMDHGTTAPLVTPLGALDLSAGDYHACLVADGANAYRIYCWGLNNDGQLGSGNDTHHDAVPQLVAEP